MSITDPGRKSIHAYVSEKAHTLWQETAAEHRLSVSALLEALAPEIADILTDRPRIVKDAGRIESERRRRNRNRLAR